LEWHPPPSAKVHFDFPVACTSFMQDGFLGSGNHDHHSKKQKTCTPMIVLITNNHVRS
jgi:hypothetical protein